MSGLHCSGLGSKPGPESHSHGLCKGALAFMAGASCMALAPAGWRAGTALLRRPDKPVNPAVLSVVNIESSSPARQTEALEALQYFPKNEALAAGAASPLVSLLVSGSPEVQSLAIEALVKLEFVTGDRNTAVAAGPSAALVSLLQSGSEEVEKAAAFEIYGLAASDEGRATIVAAGAIAPLVTLLSSKKPLVEWRAIQALTRLAEDDILRVRIVAAGAKDPLLHIISNEGLTVQKAKACLLALKLEAEEPEKADPRGGDAA